MKPSRVTASVALLTALLVGSLALVIVELTNGAAGGVSPAIARPCEARQPFEGKGLDATVQRIVLEGLDGAACQLGTTRECAKGSCTPSTPSRSKAISLRSSSRSSIVWSVPLRSRS